MVRTVGNLVDHCLQPVLIRVSLSNVSIKRLDVREKLELLGGKILRLKDLDFSIYNCQYLQLVNDNRCIIWT